MKSNATLLVIAATVGAGCTVNSDRSGDGVVITVEDGVTIVHNSSLHLADTLAWRIDATPAVSIGVVEGPEEYMIGRLAGLLRRADGDILIADGLANEVRLFDGEGRFLRSVGRTGDGPGEYGGIANLFPAGGDSLVVTDRENSRATLLDPELVYVERYQTRLAATLATPPASSHSLLGFFADGTPLFSDFLNTCGQSRMDGFCQDSVAFYRTDSAGDVLASFGSYVHGRREIYPVLRGLVTGWGEPHGQAFWRVQGDRFYYADARRLEYRVFLADATLERIVRVDAPLSTYSREEVLPQRPPAPGADERSQEANRVANDAMGRAILPDTIAWFSDMLVDEVGHVWIREYFPPGRSDQPPPRWFIFDPEGRLRYALRSPPALVRAPVTWTRMNAQIGEDFILAPARDEFGVERVELYRLLMEQP